jgi:hypothetical protein
MGIATLAPNTIVTHLSFLMEIGFGSLGIGFAIGFIVGGLTEFKIHKFFE